MPTRSLTRLRTQPIDAALSRFVRAQMRDTGTPGVAVGILNKGRAFASGFGVTSVEAPEPVDEETLFQNGSTGKTYTATAVMRLVEKGELDLDVPVRRYLRDLKLKDQDVARKVTLRHLLTHTGGWAGDYFLDTGRGEDALERAIAALPKTPQLTPLGEVWHYNNAGFYLAGRVVEKVMKKPFEAAIKELLLDPLGMTRSFFFVEDAIGYRIAAGHVTKTFRSKQQFVARPYALPRNVGPAGGIITDTIDQLRWAQFHLGDGKAPNGKRHLKVSTMRQMQTPQASAGGSIADDIGLSWMISERGGEKLVFHGGTTNGHLSAFLMVPERRFAISVLTNSSRGIAVHGAVVTRALKQYLGVEREVPEVAGGNGLDVNAYAGRYVDAFKSYAVDFDAVGARLRGKYVILDPEEDVGGALPPPFRMALVEEDQAVIEGGRLAGYKADFLRDEKGRVRWIRIGGRLLRRSRVT